MIENKSELTSLPISDFLAQDVIEKSNKNTGQDFTAKQKQNFPED